MMTLNDWIKRLKYLAFNRVTYYDNHFPSNCGEINPDGSISFDCINMPKSIINEPDIVYKTAPAGYHVEPGQVIPDWNGFRIIQELCTNVQWWNFSKIVPGEFIFMRTDGHGGVYVGEFAINGMIYNVIECTAAWGGGVIPTYIDLQTGARCQYKGGPQIYAWEAHGKLSKYIDYTEKQPKKIKVNGVWDATTTKFAQTVYKCKTISGKVKHQKKAYKKVCPACSSGWQFDNTAGYSPLIAKIQKDLKLGFSKTHPSYGKLTKKTRRSLQKKLGVKIDGIIGPETVKAFQKYLNKKSQ